MVLPLQRWSRVGEKALRFAYTLSQELFVLHIQREEEDQRDREDDLMSVWDEYIEKPAVQAGFVPPELVVLRSPYRLVITPIFKYILELERKHPNRLISVLVPELGRSDGITICCIISAPPRSKCSSYAKGNRRIVVINVPWYLRS